MVLHGFEAFVTIFKELHNLQTTNKLTNALFDRNGPYGHRLSNMLPAVIFFFFFAIQKPFCSLRSNVGSWKTDTFKVTDRHYIIRIEVKKLKV